MKQILSIQRYMGCSAKRWQEIHQKVRIRYIDDSGKEQVIESSPKPPAILTRTTKKITKQIQDNKE